MGVRAFLWGDDETAGGGRTRFDHRARDSRARVTVRRALRSAVAILRAVPRLPRVAATAGAIVSILGFAPAATPLAAASAPRSLGEFDVAVYGLTARVDPAN